MSKRESKPQQPRMAPRPNPRSEGRSQARAWWWNDTPRYIVSAIVEGGEIDALVASGLTAKDFDPFGDGEHRCVAWIFEHYQRWGKPPGLDAFRKNFPTYKLPPDATEPLAYYVSEFITVLRRMAITWGAYAVLEGLSDNDDGPDESVAHLEEYYQTTARLTQAQTRRYGWADLQALPPAPQAIWGAGYEVLWSYGEGLMLAGPQGTGKSTIAQQLALGLIGIAPDKLLGLPIEEAEGRVCYLTLDRPAQILASLRRMVDLDNAEAGETFDERFLLVTEIPGGFNIMNPADHTRLVTWLQGQGVSHVFVDSLQDLTAGHALSDDTVGSMVATCTGRLIHADLQVCTLHHTRKAQVGNRNITKLDDVYGSSWLTKKIGNVILLAGEAGSPEIEFRHLKQAAKRLDTCLLHHDHQAGRTVRRTQEETELEESLGVPLPPEGITTAEYATLSGLSRTQAGRKLRKAHQEGRVRREEQGGNQAVRWIPDPIYTV